MNINEKVKFLSLVSVFLILLLEFTLLYVQRLHLAYTMIELTILVLSLMGISLIITSFVIIRVALCSSKLQSTKAKSFLYRFLSPSYPAIKHAINNKSYVFLGFLAALLYTLLYSWMEGLITEAALGPSFKVIVEGPPGYAPMIIFFPTMNIGIIIPIYQLAVLLSLSTILGLSTAVLAYTIRQGIFSRKSLGFGLAGAFSGLLVACPVCVAPPILTILSTYLAPWVFSLFLGIFREVIGIGLTYGISILLLWFALVISSKALESGLLCTIQVSSAHNN